MKTRFFAHRYASYGLLILAGLLLITGPANAALEDHITRTETGFYYTVQKGDTLWDLSQKFSASPWVWPDLWHYNPQIPNPHLIYPGQKLLIFKKQWEGAEKARAAEPAVVAEKPAEKKESYFLYSKINGVGFIRKEPLASLGRIFKALDDPELINTGHTVYIRQADGAPAYTVGDKYTTYRTYGPYYDEDSGDLLGTQYLPTGVVEITRVEPEFAMGQIIQAYRPIYLGDEVMPLQHLSPVIVLKESKKGINGRIITSEEKNTTMMAEQSITFVNKGKDDGIEPGQFYTVYYQEKATPGSTIGAKSVLLPPVLIGEVLVLRTEETAATVLITDSKRIIEPGEGVMTLVVK